MGNMQKDKINNIPTNIIKKRFNDVKKKMKDSEFDRNRSESDIMAQVYKYKKMGFSFSAISPVLKISEKNAEKYYNQYLSIYSKRLKKQIIENDLTDVSDIIQELEHLKELAYSNQMAADEGSPASIASLKVISEILKEIAEIKLSAYARRDDLV